MHSKRLTQLSLCASVACAFQDTSPFFLYSSSTLQTINSIPAQQVAQSSQVTSVLLDTLQACPSDAYIIVSQAGVAAEDFKGHQSAPHLRKRISREDVSTGSKYVIPEVVGQMDVSSIEKQLLDKCGAKRKQVNAETGSIDLNDEYPQLITVDFASLKAASDEREAQLAKNDFFLNTILSQLPPHSYTLIYTTTPPTEKVLANQRADTKSQQHAHNVYDWNDEHINDPMHLDLKRDMSGHLSRRQSNANDSTSDRGLFEKYNFLNPGMFMGLLVSILLISLLYVGMNAVGSLQVSYAAFDREMGPRVQSKQQ